MLRGFRQRLGIVPKTYSPGKARDEPELGVQPQKQNENRSVNDFLNADELRLALYDREEKGSGDSTAWLFSANASVLQDLLATPSQVTDESGDDICSLLNEQGAKMDWLPLETYEEATSSNVSIEQELKRLLVLKSFQILDTTSPKDPFDEITSLARQTFRTSYCMISLVDLGRQWFLSKQGLEDCETPRSISFCTHGIQSVLDVFEVPDATTDVRFRNNPLVTGPPNVQYYAGAPLLSPEGFKLGMLCVVDTHPRQPLSKEQRESLKGITAIAVHKLIEHRQKMSAWFNNLIVTHFPEEEDCLTANNKTLGEEKKDNKDLYTEGEDNEEDKDLAAFIKATNDMSLESVVDMLKKEQSRELQNQQHQPNPRRRRIMPDISRVSNTRPRKRYAVGKQNKRLRFDQFEDVYEVESWKHRKKDLWWSPEEMADFRAEGRRLVSRYEHRLGYKKAVLDAFQTPEKSTEERVRELWDANVSNPRGLESSIVRVLKDNRRASRKAVMKEQWHHIQGRYDFSYFMDNLREESLQHSHMATRFAGDLAQVDRIDALFFASIKGAASA